MRAWRCGVGVDRRARSEGRRGAAALAERRRAESFPPRASSCEQLQAWHPARMSGVDRITGWRGLTVPDGMGWRMQEGARACG